jgi:hypothetical protein
MPPSCAHQHNAALYTHVNPVFPCPLQRTCGSPSRAALMLASGGTSGAAPELMARTAEGEGAGSISNSNGGCDSCARVVLGSTAKVAQ